MTYHTGIPVKIPCDVCGLNFNNQMEPRFLYTVCERHSDIPPVKIPDKIRTSHMDDIRSFGNTVSDYNWLINFVEESNRIEGMPFTASDVLNHINLLEREEITIDALVDFVISYDSKDRLRKKPGMDIRVGMHHPPPGGIMIPEMLERLIEQTKDGSPFDVHCGYQTLHPFTDCNGRSGRALWLWMMLRRGGKDAYNVQHYKFLQSFYYQTLASQDKFMVTGVRKKS